MDEKKLKDCGCMVITDKVNQALRTLGALWHEANKGIPMDERKQFTFALGGQKCHIHNG